MYNIRIYGYGQGIKQKDIVYDHDFANSFSFFPQFICISFFVLHTVLLWILYARDDNWENDAYKILSSAGDNNNDTTGKLNKKQTSFPLLFYKIEVLIEKKPVFSDKKSLLRKLGLVPTNKVW